MTLPTEPSPLASETPRSTGQMIIQIHRKINELERLVSELEIKVESAFPGADLINHRNDHEEIAERRIDRRNMIRGVRDKTLAGFLLGVAAFLGAAVVSFVVAYIKATAQ